MPIIPPAPRAQLVCFSEVMAVAAALIGVVAVVPGVQGLVGLDTLAGARSTIVNGIPVRAGAAGALVAAPVQVPVWSGAVFASGSALWRIVVCLEERVVGLVLF